MCMSARALCICVFHSWPQLGAKHSFAYRGGKFFFSQVLKMLTILWGIQTCMQSMKQFFSRPLAFPTQPSKSGCLDRTPNGVGFFPSKNPHVCVQNNQRDKGIVVRYVCWCTAATHPPSPPTRRAQKFTVSQKKDFCFVPVAATAKICCSP